MTSSVTSSARRVSTVLQAQLDGHVPQVYATWVNGLTPGRYYARAWVFRYVQTALDGSTFQEYVPGHSERVGWRHLATNGPAHQQLG